jgi:GntR family transcriptional regulator
MSADPAALPKYIALSEYLIREVASGRLLPGSRLPPERELAESLGVAVGTLRKALARLQDEGVIEAIQGSGNYIRNSAEAKAIYAFFPLERLQGGGLPRARVLSVDRVQKPAGLPAFGAGPEAWRIRRLRYLDDVPMAVEEIWLDAARADHLDPAQLSESLYLHYREKLGFWIAATEDAVGVGSVPDWGAAIGQPAGALCGRFRRISTDQTGARPEVSTTWFNSERAMYVARSR